MNVNSFTLRKKCHIQEIGSEH